jgi:hypothetical protein
MTTLGSISRTTFEWGVLLNANHASQEETNLATIGLDPEQIWQNICKNNWYVFKI